MTRSVRAKEHTVEHTHSHTNGLISHAAGVTLVVRPWKVVSHGEATTEGQDLVNNCQAKVVVLRGYVRRHPRPSESSPAGMS